MDVLTELKQGFEDFKAKNQEAVENLKKMHEEIKNGTKEGVDNAVLMAEKAAKDVQSLADRLVETEQKIVDGVVSGKKEPKSLGEMIANSEEYKAFASGQTSKVRIETDMRFGVRANTITGQSGSPATNDDDLVQTMRIPGIIPGAFRALRVKDVILPGNTNSNMIEFTRELAWTSSAAETNENSSKPESSLTFELATANVATVAHWLKATKQILEDAPALASYIDARMRYGVENRVDAQLLTGNGTNPNMKGITHSDNRTAFTPTSGDNAIDSISRAKASVIGADYAPTAIIMNPSDWSAIERLKVGTSDNRYVIGDPLGMIVPTIWGIPVVLSNNMTATYFVIGAMNIAFQYFQRSGVVVEMTEYNDTDFEKNLVTIRAEERLALAGYRPASVYYGALTT